ncbi:MAG TPA: dihydroorotate dehydrogenase electron transfer subunit [Steroidobacteraceae bacterium]|nr:dihydroorotate dehydrogenase electron transfer subunit [Steroidobacteraceae bacterium]
MSSARPHRGTIFLEDAPVVSHAAHPAQQFVLRLAAPKCAARAQPGAFVHLTCDAAVPLRRPLSIMRVNREEGWIEILYKIVGPGLEALSHKRRGDTVSVLGPIGHGFTPDPARPRALLLGGGVGIPPMIFLADALRGDPGARYKPLVLMGSEVPFPFEVRPSRILLPGLPPDCIACLPLLDEWEIASRLASRSGFPGCFDGFVTELADHWLGTLSGPQLAEVQIYACGPTPMLKACAELARRREIPCQVALEEFMACGVGGCAGCTVLVRTAGGPAMKRVCVDGPVFDALAVY